MGSAGDAGPDRLPEVAREAGGHLASALGALGDNMALYFTEIERFPLLTHEEEIALARQIERPRELRADAGLPLPRVLERAERGAYWARDYFVCCNLRLVVSIAKRASGGNPELILDLIQEGNLALIRAVELYDWRTGFRFSTYGTPWVRHAIRTARTEWGRSIHLSPLAHQDTARILAAERALLQEGVAQPSSAQIGARCDLPPGYTRHLLALARPFAYLSEAGTRHHDDISDVAGQGHSQSLIDQGMAEVPEAIDDEGLRRGLLDCLLELRDSRPAGPKEVLTILARSGLSAGVAMTLLDVGSELGVSRERARQHERDASAFLAARAGHLRSFWVERLGVGA